jgi:hypothetical protein
VVNHIRHGYCSALFVGRKHWWGSLFLAHYYGMLAHRHALFEPSTSLLANVTSQHACCLHSRQPTASNHHPPHRTTHRIEPPTASNHPPHRTTHRIEPLTASHDQRHHLTYKYICIHFPQSTHHPPHSLTAPPHYRTTTHRTTSRYMCIHFRRGDFVTAGWLGKAKDLALVQSNIERHRLGPDEPV